MAAIKATMNGVVIDYYGRVISGPVKIVGELMYSDRHVGGGPLPGGPGDGGGGGGDPPGIWGGPIDPYPDHGLPQPPGTWPPQRPPHPAHPIVLPPDGGKPPIDPPTEPPTNPPNVNWQWVYVPDGSGGRWTPGYVPGANDAQPH